MPGAECSSESNTENAEVSPFACQRGAYDVDGIDVVPTAYATGPWFPEQQHGASVMALLARFLERVPSAQPMRLTRITADISRAIPMAPIRVKAELLRDGKRVQSLVAEIVHDGSVVGRAVATRIRVQPGLVPPELLPPLYPEDAAPPFPDKRDDFRGDYTSFHDCLELRCDQTDDVGNAVRWFRLTRPVVTGEAPTPIVRMAATADFVPSSGLRLGRAWVSINPEVTLQIEREPVGEWLCNVNRVRFTDDGIGMSSGVMFDRARRVGCSAKSVLNYQR